jgi:4'-phosphopantetheinyl transferase EntD
VPLIEQVLPPGVAAAEAFSDPPDVRLFPEEEEAVARAVGKRRREFTTGRACAREALAQLGFAAAPITCGPKGAPRWPDGVVGSITHCDGYRACAVARSGDAASVGIDAEPNLPMPDGVLEVVSDHAEREHLAALAASRPDVQWGRLLFSAKESVYKTWFPLAGRWLGFEEASITIDPESATFTATLRTPPLMVNDTPLTQFPGRWLSSDSLLITAIALPGKKESGRLHRSG